MSYEEEFDKIIRQKAGEADFPFDDANWQKTSRMLDAEKAIAKKLLWKKMLIPGVVVVAVGTVSLLAFNHFNAPLATTESQKNILSEQAAQQAAQPATQPAIESNEIAALPEEKKTGPASTATNFSPDKNKAIVTAPEIQTEINKKDNTNLASVIPSENKETPVVHIDNVVIPAVADPVVMKDPEATVQQETETTPNAAVATFNKEVVPVTVTDKTAQQTDTKTQPETNAPAEDVIVTTNEAAIVLQADELSPVYSMLDPGMQEFTPNFDELIILKRYEDYYSKKAKTHFLNLEAGAAYLSGWESTLGTDAKGINWFGGINYGYYICKKTSISLGIQAYDISNITQPFYKGSEKSYGFGSSNSYTVISTNNLIYAAVPLKLTYHLNPSNQLGLGFNAAYLVQAQNHTSVYEIGENGRRDISDTNSKGVYDQMESFNYMASVFYNIRLKQRVGINAEFTYGLTDIFQNNATNNGIQKPMGLRLSLQYYLFDK